MNFGASLTPLFFALLEGELKALVLRQPNQERSSLPLLTVLLILTGERQEEVGGVKNERDGTSEAWALQRSFTASVLGEIRRTLRLEQ